MSRPQQSTNFQASASQNCNSPRTYEPGKKNLQSTKHVKSEGEVDEDRNFYQDTETVKTHEICANIIPFNLKRKGFSDPNGALLRNSSIGNLHVMVMYDYDSNEILVEPIKNRQSATTHDELLKIHKGFKAIGRN